MSQRPGSRVPFPRFAQSEVNLDREVRRSHSRISALMKPRLVLEWLEDLEPSVGIGETGSICDCPFTVYLRHFGVMRPEIHGTEIRHYLNTVGGRDALPLEPWAIRAIEQLDALAPLGSRPVRAREFLAIMRKITDEMEGKIRQN